MSLWKWWVISSIQRPRPEWRSCPRKEMEASPTILLAPKASMEAPWQPSKVGRDCFIQFHLSWCTWRQSPEALTRSVFRNRSHEQNKIKCLLSGWVLACEKYGVAGCQWRKLPGLEPLKNPWRPLWDWDYMHVFLHICYSFLQRASTLMEAQVRHNGDLDLVHSWSPSTWWQWTWISNYGRKKQLAWAVGHGGKLSGCSTEHLLHQDLFLSFFYAQ